MNIRNTAIAILAILTVAVSGAPAYAAPDNQVTGSGTFATVQGLGDARVSVAARVDPEASRATGTGQIQIILADETVHGTVTCLLVRLDEAYMTGTLREPIDGNEYFRFSVRDGDLLGSGPDLAELVFFPEPVGCARGNPEIEVTSGNYVVKNQRL